MTNRPVRPEPAECPKIKKAMRAARFMKGWAPLVAGTALIAAIIIGGTCEWYFGVIVFTVSWAALFIFCYSAARCPRCGQVWWGDPDAAAVTDDETESMVCRTCRLDIGLGLREP
jgi:hypothetical protein